MIPIRLMLQNFLSYGEPAQEIDFTKFSIACLSGKNGHGKSALLDGVTWAIWGETSKSSKSNEKVVRIGSTETIVEFDFLLSDELYRVVRTYNLGKSRPHVLSFQIFDENAASFHTLDDVSISQTQNKINETLKVDYDTFVNSSFLLQGRSNEFAKKSPSQRKEILAKILNLGIYSRLEKLAKEDKKNALKEIEFIQRRIAEFEEHISEKKGFEESLTINEEQLSQIEKVILAVSSEVVQLQKNQESFELLKKQNLSLQNQLKNAEEEKERLIEKGKNVGVKLTESKRIISLEDEIERNYKKFLELQEEAKILSQKQTELAVLKQNANEIEKKIATTKNGLETQEAKVSAEINSHKKRMENLLQIQKRKNEIEKGFEDLKKAETTFKEVNSKQEILQELETQRQNIFTKIEKEKTVLETEIQNNRNKISDFKGKLSQVAHFQKQLSELKEKAILKEKLENELREIETDGKSLRENFTNLIPKEILNLKTEISDLEEKNTLLHQGENSCPICQSELSEGRFHQVENHYETEIKIREKKIQTLKNELGNTKEKLNSLTEKFKTEKQKLISLKEIDSKIGEIQSKVKESESFKAEVEMLKNEILEKETKIKNRDFSKPERVEYSKISSQISELNFSTEELRKLSSLVDSLAHFKVEFAKLTDSQTESTELREKILELTQRRKQFEELLETENFSLEERAELEKIGNQILKIHYEPKKHEFVKENLENLKDAVSFFEKLKNAKGRISELEVEIIELRKEGARKLKQVEELSKEVAEIQKAISEQNDLSFEIEEAQSKLKIQTEIKTEKLTDIGSLKEKLNQVLESEKSLAKFKEETRAFREEHFVSEEVEKMFSKNGIPALIIENEIEQIEVEANEILSRLTNGTTALVFQTQRETKGGEFRESLDIIISDVLGSRNYELYSGGESFRIDFALRVAISKVLAQRAGTRLQTLVIDEGFGTQDDEGLENLIEAINSIKDDFEKILIVTHLESLKNVFPVRLEVEKHPQRGSLVSIVN
ncbi:MAG: hypothetical protein DWQ06_13395 [Calditrichaeota bacterium]|nr:MAG: hypothetical protein DWQ06_13395 [Calditrichota bacterium]